METVFLATTGDRHLQVIGGLTALERRVRECAKRGVALATAPPNTLRLGPPLTTTTDHIDQGVDALRDALDALAEVAVGPAVARV